jgi:phosphoribosyl 1,2-cyclic phosphodiesterase
MTFRLRFWGTRGSIPTPGSNTVRYGGNTPCVEVHTETNWLVVLDAGTGIRELGRALISRSNGGPPTGDPIAADIFLTHAHWDHIQGIPFFAPIFQPGNHFTIWGSKTLETSIDRVIRDQMSPVVFPISFEELSARIDFREIAEERCVGNGYEVTAFAVQHPGGALGYRFASVSQTPELRPEVRSAERRSNEAIGKDQGGSFVYISDNELAAHETYKTRPDWRDRLVDFVRGAALLIHDATYTTAEYERHRGWGHSTHEEVVNLALDAGVEHLVLFHHRPERSDDDLDGCVASCQALVRSRGSKMSVVAAAEGMTLMV